MSILLAVTLAGGMAGQDPASLLARIEALEARSRDLEARLERLGASTAPSTSQPPLSWFQTAVQSRPPLYSPAERMQTIFQAGLSDETVDVDALRQALTPLDSLETYERESLSRLARLLEDR